MKNCETDLTFLKKLDIFHLLPDMWIDYLLEQAKSFCYSAGELIFEAGSQGEVFYIVRSGKIGFYLDSDYVRNGIYLNELSTGEYFGEYSLAITESETTHSVNAIAITESILIIIEKQVFLNVFYNDNSVSSRIMRALIHRVRFLSNYVRIMQEWTILLAHGDYRGCFNVLTSHAHNTNQSFPFLRTLIQIIEQIEEKETSYERNVCHLRSQLLQFEMDLAHEKVKNESSDFIYSEQFSEICGHINSIRKSINIDNEHLNKHTVIH